MNTLKLGKNNGTISYVNWSEDQTGSRVANDFLLKIIAGVCKRSMDHWRALEKAKFHSSMPLRLQERMLYSIFAASIAELTPVHLSEMPVERKQRGSVAEPGRTDFWAYYRNRNFFLELKRTTIGLKTPWSEKLLKKKFARVELQTTQLQREAKTWRSNGSGQCILMGLQVILPYRIRAGSKEENSGKFNLEEGQLHSMDLIKAAKALHKNVDFCAVWHPPTHAAQFEFEPLSGGRRTEWNPYYGFVAKNLF